MEELIVLECPNCHQEMYDGFDLIQCLGCGKRFIVRCRAFGSLLQWEFIEAVY
jgi:hypothetical protein